MKKLNIAARTPDTHLAVRFAPAAETSGEGAAGEGAAGDGTDDLVVLYIHGFGSRQTGTKAEYFRRRFAEAGLSFCSFDFQGHGESGGSMLGLSLSRNLEDIAVMREFLRERGYRRVILMGSSMGGGSALWSGARDGQDVVAGIQIAPSLAMHEGVLSRIAAEEAERWEREGVLELKNDIGSWHVGWGLIEDLRSYDLRELYRGHRVPTLIFQGKQDDTVPWERAVDFAVAHEAEQVELVLMADADHRMIDRLDHLWRVASSFLGHHGLLPRRDSTVRAAANSGEET